jgi:hypothetical protein
MSNIKQAPFLGLIGLGGGGTGLTVGGSADKKTWVDDFFGIQLRKSTGAVATVNNAMDLSGDGGLVWTKSRSNAFWNVLYDTSRGGAYSLTSNNSNAQANNVSGAVTFNNNGYSIAAGYAENNASGYTYADWVFKKQQGFFDIVEWSGNSSTNQTISHNLGCKPGCIIIKSKSNTSQWPVYHRAAGDDKYLYLNEADTASSSGSPDWSGTTDTQFVAQGAMSANESGYDYVAYLFGGGESSASGARSVNFNGSSQRLQIADTNDLEIGNDKFTMECWFRQDANSGSGSDSHTLLSKWDNDGRKEFIWRISDDSSKQCLHWLSSSNGSSNDANFYGNSRITNGTWNHAAVTRDGGGVIRMFLNGSLQQTTATQASTHQNSHEFMIGANGSSGIEQFMDGDISNVRFIKGQCLWTTSFKPTNEPLTTTSQGATASLVSLLCCNQVSDSGSTVTPGTIVAVGGPSGRPDSPFDDLGGFVFGDDGEQNVIKCGKYIGNSSADIEIYTGWQPQYIMFKSLESSNNWSVFDSLRGIVTEGDENYLYPNLANAEYVAERISLTPTGFIVDASAGVLINENDKEMMWMAIRMPDGYVGKPPEAGTDAFAMDVGNGSSDISVPNFDSGFPVDLGIYKQTAATNDWVLSDRLISGRWLRTNGTNPEATYSGIKFDSNVGWAAGGFNTAVQSWMWKRGQGCDVVTYEGLSGVREIPHSLAKPAEMIFIKRMDGSEEWAVGADAMTDWNKYMKLNTNDGELNAYGTFNSTAPTSTHFSLSTSGRANYTGYRYVAMLFASVTGISKCGSYTGSSTTITVTTGFQPRFIIIKRVDSGGSWLTWDTVRGWVDGNNNPSLEFNTDGAQTTGNAYTGGPISTGFTLNSNADYNGSGATYLYYAHS